MTATAGSKARSRFHFLHRQNDLHRYSPTNTQNDGVYASVTVRRRVTSVPAVFVRVHTPYVQSICDNIGGRL